MQTGERRTNHRSGESAEGIDRNQSQPGEHPKTDQNPRIEGDIARLRVAGWGAILGGLVASSVKGRVRVVTARREGFDLPDTIGIEASHLAAMQHLPPIHTDPFDRALVAQASATNATLVTRDRSIPSHDVATLC